MPKRVQSIILVVLSVLVSCRPVSEPAPEQATFAGRRRPAPTIPVGPEHVVERLPHDPTGFVQGFFYADGYFIESTGGYGGSSLRRVEPETGRVLIKRELPYDIFGEGCAPTGAETIVQLTWRNRVAYVYQAETLRRIAVVDYPREGWGLLFDGSRLVASDGSHRLYWLDPVSLRTLRQVEVRTADGRRLQGINEMAWVEGSILANVFPTNYIVQINPASGLVENKWDLSAIVAEESPPHPEHVLNGVAYDPGTGRLWVTGKCWRHVYQVRLPHMILPSTR